jgi:pyrimidine deaminase RibD-like protein
MRAALAEGRKALPACRPNPPVGCVLVRDGQIIARGHTQPPYQPHAEPMALNQLADAAGQLPDLSDVIAYVTLEPCSFHNRTPSCARTMVAAGIRTVVIGMPDPHPRNRGEGTRLLREGGATVIESALEAEVRADLAQWVWQPGEPDDAKVGE